VAGSNQRVKAGTYSSNAQLESAHEVLVTRALLESEKPNAVVIESAERYWTR
jgi:hypothetical protein